MSPLRHSPNSYLSVVSSSSSSVACAISVAFNSFSRPSFTISGKITVDPSTTSSVPIPPKITDPTAPNHLAVSPDSSSPSSFEQLIKRNVIEDTRPRIASGVIICVMGLLSIWSVAFNPKYKDAPIPVLGSQTAGEVSTAPATN